MLWFNLLNASKHLTLPLKLGINNDNYDLLAELGTILKQEDYSLIILINNHNLSLVKFLNVKTS